ncbi:MAG: sensor domain-containing protein [Mycobacterium sp.]
MSLFISYSSRDRAGLDNVLSALRRGHEEVWFDEELGAGEVWWRTILERIRDCEVFIFAISANSLESKPCLAELRYAQDLDKPVVPVQIGPLSSMRVTPLAQVEAIDYQNPTVDSGIRLITAVREAREQARPLPSPLPDEPPVPFAYLMRLASTISGATLDPHQQMSLVAELKTGLEEDGHDDAARRDITQLLCVLRDRPDVTYRTRTDIEGLLASLGDAPVATAAPHAPPAPAAVAPVAQPVPQPQPVYPPAPPQPKTGRSSRTWIILAAVAAACVVAAVIAVIMMKVAPGPSPAPTPAQPPKPLPTVTPSQVDSLLLSTDEVAKILGASDLTPSQVFTTMAGSTTKISDQDCLGTAYSAQRAVYDGSGWSAVGDQTFKQPTPDNPGDNSFWADQTAVTFPSQDQARAFLEKSAQKWESCAGKTVDVTFTDSDSSSTWTFGELNRTDDDKISQLGTQEGARGWACQHTLTAYSNVVFEAIACSDQIGDEAARIVEQMVTGVKS